MCRKGKQAFMAREFYPFRASRWVIKPHCERGGQERPFQSWGTRRLGRKSRLQSGDPSLYSHRAPEVALSRVPTNRWLWSMLPLTGTCGARLRGQGPWEGNSVSSPCPSGGALGNVNRWSHGDRDSGVGPGLSHCSQDQISPEKPRMGQCSVCLCARACVHVCVQRGEGRGRQRTQIMADIRFLTSPGKKRFRNWFNLSDKNRQVMLSWAQVS